MSSVLPPKFFARHPQAVAKELVGKVLVRRRGKNVLRFLICETEAYAGKDDGASHARMGKTARNAVMFGPAGTWYVYLIYGMHYCLNVVTGKNGEASAVLIRGLKDLSGPGKICKSLSIGRSFNGRLASKRIGLWIEDAANAPPKVRATPRVNVSGSARDKKKKWRFVL